MGRWACQSVACSCSQPGGNSWERMGRVCKGDLPGSTRCQSQQRAQVFSGEAARGPRAHTSGGQIARRTPTPPPARQLSASQSVRDATLTRRFVGRAPGAFLALSREQPWAMMGPALALVNPARGAAEWTLLERLSVGLGNAPIIPQRLPAVEYPSFVKF